MSKGGKRVRAHTVVMRVHAAVRATGGARLYGAYASFSTGCTVVLLGCLVMGTP